MDQQKISSVVPDCSTMQHMNPIDFSVNLQKAEEYHKISQLSPKVLT